MSFFAGARHILETATSREMKGRDDMTDTPNNTPNWFNGPVETVPGVGSSREILARGLDCEDDYISLVIAKASMTRSFYLAKTLLRRDHGLSQSPEREAAEKQAIQECDRALWAYEEEAFALHEILGGEDMLPKSKRLAQSLEECLVELEAFAELPLEEQAARCDTQLLCEIQNIELLAQTPEFVPEDAVDVEVSKDRIRKIAPKLHARLTEWAEHQIVYYGCDPFGWLYDLAQHSPSAALYRADIERLRAMREIAESEQTIESARRYLNRKDTGNALPSFFVQTLIELNESRLASAVSEKQRWEAVLANLQ